MDHLTEYLNAERGRRTLLARQLGITPSALSMWKRVPVERVVEIERLTGVSRHDLRPDVFGARPAAPDGEEPSGPVRPAPSAVRDADVRTEQ